MLLAALLVTTLVRVTSADRCPPLFGESECPMHYTCVDGQCASTAGQLAPITCDGVVCPDTTRCYKGRCYPTSGLVCNRNVLFANLTAKSVESNCGFKGKCINGRCVEDRCVEVSCGETQMCRDGQCVEMSGVFCLTHFDCGPLLECVANKCTYVHTPLECNCDPGEVCQQGRCYPDPKCSHVSCSEGSVCSEGVCVTAVGRDCTQDACPAGTVCVRGRCALDACQNRCPADHACRQGECRHLQGMLCTAECPSPYACVDGLCTRNECAHKGCQLGEACENGLCIKIEGRFCTLAIRDCAQDFECESNACREKMEPLQSI